MNKFSLDVFDTDSDKNDRTVPLSAEEIAQLRGILQVVRYDTPSKTLRIDTGKAKILVRGDGSVRIEGKRLTQISQGALVLNGATIELN